MYRNNNIARNCPFVHLSILGIFCTALFACCSRSRFDTKYRNSAGAQQFDESGTAVPPSRPCSCRSSAMAQRKAEWRKYKVHISGISGPINSGPFALLRIYGRRLIVYIAEWKENDIIDVCGRYMLAAHRKQNSEFTAYSFRQKAPMIEESLQGGGESPAGPRGV
jgi:hypothetical protein